MAFYIVGSQIRGRALPPLPLPTCPSRRRQKKGILPYTYRTLLFCAFAGALMAVHSCRHDTRSPPVLSSPRAEGLSGGRQEGRGPLTFPPPPSLLGIINRASTQEGGGGVSGAICKTLLLPLLKEVGYELWGPLLPELSGGGV